MNVPTLLVAGLTQGAIYALVALGLVLLYKTQDMVNWAHGEMLMLGAFAGYTGYQILAMPYWLAFISAIVVVGLLGAAIERSIFRHLTSFDHIKLSMVTVGLSSVFKGFARIPFGNDIYPFPPAFGSGQITVGEMTVSPQDILVIAVAAGIATMLFGLFHYTTLGKQMRATQQNFAGAQLCGVNIGQIFSVTWATSAGLGAAAGVLAGPIALLYPDMGSNFLLKGFAAAVLGGFESVPGAIIAGFLVGLIEIFVGAYLSSAFQQVSAFFIIILILLLRPQGLFGRPSAARV